MAGVIAGRVIGFIVEHDDGSTTLERFDWQERGDRWRADLQALVAVLADLVQLDYARADAANLATRRARREAKQTK